uniref:Dirigent protein n=1 Tax=Oryza glumipatula TaxID=40148 RepID=A0A0E0AUF3_9ORYZ
MATPSHCLIFLFLCLPAVLANILGDIYPCPCKCSQENETCLHMHLHQFPALPGVPNRNEYGVINSTEPIGFGQMYGPMQMKMLLDVYKAFISKLVKPPPAGTWLTPWCSAIAGSTIEVSGLLGFKPNGQWSITGGTGTFASAHGTIKFTNSQSSTATDDIRELDIHVFHTPEAVV